VKPTASESPTRPVGRPRASQKELTDDSREEVLTAAAQLFEANGFTATTTEAIAAAAGLSEASLFHYFDRKQDIMVELLGRAVRPTLKVVRQNRLELYEPDVAVWQLVHMDVSILCRGPSNVGALQLLPEVRTSEFDWYWRRRHQLFRVYTDHIARGFVAGVFTEGDPRTAGELVFGLVESVIIARPQFRRRTSTPFEVADASLRICGVPAARIREVASTPIALEGFEQES
jgi:AcrR family transcriptional regulator